MTKRSSTGVEAEIALLRGLLPPDAPAAPVSPPAKGKPTVKNAILAMWKEQRHPIDGKRTPQLRPRIYSDIADLLNTLGKHYRTKTGKKWMATTVKNFIKKEFGEAEIEEVDEDRKQATIKHQTECLLDMHRRSRESGKREQVSRKGIVWREWDHYSLNEMLDGLSEAMETCFGPNSGWTPDRVEQTLLAAGELDNNRIRWHCHVCKQENVCQDHHAHTRLSWMLFLVCGWCGEVSWRKETVISDDKRGRPKKTEVPDDPERGAKRRKGSEVGWEKTSDAGDEWGTETTADRTKQQLLAGAKNEVAFNEEDCAHDRLVLLLSRMTPQERKTLNTPEAIAALQEQVAKYVKREKRAKRKGR
jgi:hypothetical protein